MAEVTDGQDWTDKQNDLVVADYFAMLKAARDGGALTKLHRYRALSELIGKSHKAVERKHQNISAVLEKIGLQWMAGLAPLRNYQASLIAAVDRYLSEHPHLFGAVDAEVSTPAVFEERIAWKGEKPALVLVAPPLLTADDRKSTDALDRLVRKFDPSLRDAKNRRLGRAGEEVVFHFERTRLQTAGRHDLARKVEWTSQERGDGAGYDIASFDPTGAERFIEVKTTNGPAKTPFFLSENERSFSEERTTAFRLIRLHEFATRPCAFELEPPLSNFIALSPISYRAELR